MAVLLIRCVVRGVFRLGETHRPAARTRQAGKGITEVEIEGEHWQV
jgi:hypothetical protein